MELRFKSAPLLHHPQTDNIDSKPQSESLFASTLRKNVNEYFKEKGISTKGNFNLALQTFSMISLYLAPFILLLTLPVTWWVGFLLTVVMGIGVAGVGMCVMHDAVHGSFSKKEWLNKLLGGTMYLLGGSVFNWKMQHNVLHHTYTNINGGDGDIGARWPLRLSDNLPVLKIHKYQYIHAFFFYGLMTITKIVNDFIQLAGYNKAGMTRKYKINTTKEYFKMAAYKLAYLFVLIGLPIIFTHFTWWQVLIGFFMMHWVAGCILSTIFQMAHIVEGADQPLPDANGVINHDWTVHELLTTSDFARNNWFVNWYIGGLNFQIEHHLFPYISHVHYRKLAPIVERTAHEFGFDYNLKPSFVNAFRSHIRRLKELGIQPASKTLVSKAI
ncbi:MAG TPA: acyl-CoA desaturase [Bacteroidia bacterium]|nr:acyl-CoA desaturase [Bacteroidia bacterium]